MLKQTGDRRCGRGSASDEVGGEGRDEGNVEEVMDGGEDRELMNPPIFYEKKMERVGSSELLTQCGVNNYRSCGCVLNFHDSFYRKTTLRSNTPSNSYMRALWVRDM